MDSKADKHAHPAGAGTAPTLPGWRPEQLAELYRELRKTARALRRRSPSGTLNTTAVVHEAWLRYLADKPAWQDRRHFLAAASMVMRRVLVDYARERAALKRGADTVAVVAAEVAEDAQPAAYDMLVLEQALQRLEDLDPRLARLVELRAFGGLT
ncbi:MAG TPA: ECF-type sigma factor, partial [Xanthomonadaceae bacterium]|nr:ECF-type sigma factor [Xanthomonadaceae bacterium]